MKEMHCLIMLTLLLGQTAATNISLPDPDCNQEARFWDDLITKQNLTKHIVLISKDQMDLDLPGYIFTRLSSERVDYAIMSSVHQSMINANTRALYVINDPDKAKELILQIRRFNK